VGAVLFLLVLLALLALLFAARGPLTPDLPGHCSTYFLTTPVRGGTSM